ncbi:MAG: hypothetical protein ABI549_08645 [Flavobacterium sp.]|uniref:hypothetical protein n=1 Tax=Flavobacterium sp. TaxID=239 RepID=UPI003262FC1E
MNKIDFLQEWFYKEEDRKGILNDSLNIPIGILTGILAGVYFLVSKYNYCSGSEILKFIFITLIVVSIIFWLICITYLLLSYNPRTHIDGTVIGEIRAVQYQNQLKGGDYRRSYNDGGGGFQMLNSNGVPKAQVPPTIITTINK